jgi:hypothetical protein
MATKKTTKTSPAKVVKSPTNLPIPDVSKRKAP